MDLIRFIIAKIDLVGGKAPDEFVLFKKGWGELMDGRRYLVDRESYELVAAFWKTRGIDIVIDYEHQTLTGQEAPAAAWIKTLSWDEQRGIIAGVQWTEKGAAYIAKAEYKYFSPVFNIRQKDQRLVALLSVALTNTPLTNNLEAIAAKLDAIYNPIKEERNMEFFKQLFEKLGLKEGAKEADVLSAIDIIVAKATIFTKEVLATLGLQEGAGNKDIMGAINTIAAKAIGIPKEVLDVLDLAAGSTTSSVVASINALKQAPKGMVTRAEFDAVVAKQKQRDADEAVAAAMSAGKITPDQKDWAGKYAMSDLAGFQLFVAKAPVVIPVDKLPKQDTKGDAVVDETTLAIGKLFGNTAEDFKKYSGIQA